VVENNNVKTSTARGSTKYCIQHALLAMCILAGCAGRSSHENQPPPTATRLAISVVKLNGLHVGKCSKYQRQLFGSFLSKLSDGGVPFDTTDASQPVTVFSEREFSRMVQANSRDENIVFATASTPIYLPFHRGTNAIDIPLTQFAMIAHPRRPIEPRIEFFILIPPTSYAPWPNPVYFLLPIRGDPLNLRQGECGRATGANIPPKTSPRSGVGSSEHPDED